MVAWLVGWMVAWLVTKLQKDHFALGAGETREKRTDRLDNLHVPSELMYIPAMSPLAYNRKSLVFNWSCQLVKNSPRRKPAKKPDTNELNNLTPQTQ